MSMLPNCVRYACDGGSYCTYVSRGNGNNGGGGVVVLVLMGRDGGVGEEIYVCSRLVSYFL